MHWSSVEFCALNELAVAVITLLVALLRPVASGGGIVRGQSR